MRGETGATLWPEDLRLQRRLGLPRQTHSTPPLLTDHEPPHALASPAGLGRTPRGYGLCGPRGDHPTESAEGEKLHFAAGQPGTSPFGLAEEVESVAKRHPGEGGTCLRHVFLERHREADSRQECFSMGRPPDGRPWGVGWETGKPSFGLAEGAVLARRAYPKMPSPPKLILQKKAVCSGRRTQLGLLPSLVLG